MTIGKRLLSLALLLLVLSACLVSCKNKADGGEESDDALSMLLEIVESAETTAEAGCYVIVLPAGCTGALVENAQRLSDGIEEIVGVECVIEYDNSDTPRRDNAIEIILGAAERDESKILLSKLRANDYICKKANENIVIGGVTESATLTALNKFIDEILPYASSDQLMSSGAEFEYVGSYKLDGVKLCGFPIGDFDIVCGTEPESVGVANRLYLDILSESGYALNIRDKQRDGFKEIVLELVETEDYVDKAYILYDGEDVTLRAYSAYGMNAASDNFRELLLVEEQTDVLCLSEEWTSLEVNCPNRLISVEHITFDETASGFLTLDCVSAIHGELRENAPAVVLMSEMSASVWNIMRANLPDGYLYRAFGQGSISAVAYDSSVVELSATTVRDGDAERTDILFSEIGGTPSYRITYLYSDILGDVSGILSKVNSVISENVADIVLVEHAVAPSADVSAGEGLLDRADVLQTLGDGTRYIDAFATGNALNYSDVSAELVRGRDGDPLGFTCRATRVSFNRAEFVS